MNDERSGIDRLRAAVDDVATTLGPPASRPRRGSARVVAGILAGALVVLASAAWIARHGIPPGASAGERMGIEVQELRVRGESVDARVFDVAGAGTIVVAPRARSQGE